MGRLLGGRGRGGGHGSRGGRGGGRGGGRAGRGGGHRGGRGSAAEPPSLDMSRDSSPEPLSESSSQRQARFLPGFEFARITFERHNLEQLRLPLKFARQLAGHEPTEVGLRVAGCARGTWPIKLYVDAADDMYLGRGWGAFATRTICNSGTSSSSSSTE
jgi:hypothetical protein